MFIKESLRYVYKNLQVNKAGMGLKQNFIGRICAYAYNLGRKIINFRSLDKLKLKKRQLHHTPRFRVTRNTHETCGRSYNSSVILSDFFFSRPPISASSLNLRTLFMFLNRVFVKFKKIYTFIVYILSRGSEAHYGLLRQDTYI